MLFYLGNLNVPWQTCWSSQLCLEREGKGGLEGWQPAEGAGQAIAASRPRFHRNSIGNRLNSSPSQFPKQPGAGTSDWHDCDITKVLNKFCFYFY